MAINSMTGFARSTGSIHNSEWIIELRSVNGRGLDIRMRLPSGMEALDGEFRNRVKNNFERGNLSLTLTFKRDKNSSQISLNEQAFNDLLLAANKAAEISKLPLKSIDCLLSNKNILQEIEPENAPEIESEIHKEILKTFDVIIKDLKQARKEEGALLSSNITERLEKIDQLTHQAEMCPDNQAQTILQNLKKNVETLIEQSEQLDPDRLHQEAVLLSTKSDIAEEIDRLKAHIKHANDLLSKNEAVGRRLDFLCQEFNREANTICSKSCSQTLTYIGLELKTIIDQMREQVQNIE